ncbi:MAG: hypothetical protein AB8H12_20635 [Lewinella sp.]
MSQSDAIKIARELGSKDILSGAGVDYLKKAIENGELKRPKTSPFSQRNGTSGRQITDRLDNAQLLFALGAYYEAEFYHRVNLKELFAYQEEINNFLQSGEPTKEKTDSLNAAFKAKVNDLPGARIESKIPDEDGTGDGGFTISLMDRMRLGGTQTEAIPGGLISEQRSVMGKSRKRTLRDLVDLGLVGDEDYLTSFTAKQMNEVGKEYFFIYYLAAKVAEQEDAADTVEKINAFARSLTDAGVIKAATLKEFIAKNKATGIRNKWDLLSYCDAALVVEMGDYTGDSLAFSRAIYSRITKLLPEFIPQIVSLDREPEPGWEKRLTLITTLTAGGQTYRAESFSRILKSEDDRPDLPASFYSLHPTTELPNAVNNWLRDQDSKQRLFYVNERFGGKNGIYGEERFGLILLTQPQLEAWGESHDYFLFGPSFDNSFSNRNIEDKLSFLKEIGVFDGMTEQKMTEGKACVSLNSPTTNGYLLNCFEDLVVYFDWEAGNLENPYEELTTKLARASRGFFSPTKITDKFARNMDQKTTPFSFTLNGAKYEQNLRMESDWLDPGFLELIREALSAQSIKGDFHYILNDGQAAGYVFLMEEQREAILNRYPDFFPKY